MPKASSAGETPTAAELAGSQTNVRLVTRNLVPFVTKSVQTVSKDQVLPVALHVRVAFVMMDYSVANKVGPINGRALEENAETELAQKPTDVNVSAVKISMGGVIVKRVVYDIIQSVELATQVMV